MTLTVQSSNKGSDQMSNTDKILERANKIITCIQQGTYPSRSFVFQKSSSEHFAVKSASNIRDLFFSEGSQTGEVTRQMELLAVDK